MLRFVSVLVLAVTLTAQPLQADPLTDTLAFDTERLNVAGLRVGNPLDPATWWNAHGASMAEMTPIAINPMDPDFWIAFIDPPRHGHAHMTFMNPASMGQFMKPETYSAMMDPAVWIKWADPQNYAPLFDPQTYAYWMQPGAYAHMLDPGQFEPMLDAGNYTAVLTAAADTLGLSDWAGVVPVPRPANQ